MKGWEKFASVPNSVFPPTSRPLGVVTFPKRNGEILIEEGTEEWPDDEVRGGVAYVKVEAHGDDPGAYVYVCGPDRAAVEACFDRVVARIVPFLGGVWP